MIALDTVPTFPEILVAIAIALAALVVAGAVIRASVLSALRADRMERDEADRVRRPSVFDIPVGAGLVLHSDRPVSEDEASRLRDAWIEARRRGLP